MNRQQRQDAWAMAVQGWLDVSFKPLADHARTMANGDRGVLVVSLDTKEMLRVIEAPPGTTIEVSLDPVWLPTEEFLKVIKEYHDDRDAWRRWGTVLHAMDPARDVALYLHNDPETDPEGYTFSRFLCTTEGLNPEEQKE